jgi:hypothetical protein
MEPPEAQSIKSMLHIARILAIIFAILFLLGGLVSAAVLFVVGLGVFAVFPILFIIWAVVLIVIYIQLKEIEAMVNQRRYEEAKSKTLIWMILGFILAGIIIGILLLIAYLKFDPLISWQRSAGGAPPTYGAPAPAPGMVAPAPAPMAPPPPPAAAPAAAPVPNCASCGRPTTYIAQYGRYYCYPCAKYV